jgi:uncharacterized membrane protein
MYGRAKILGHPIHPALVAFPIAFYVTTLATLIVFAVGSDPFWYHVAAWTSAAGVITAGVAAAPGLLDLSSVPSHARAHQVGLAHGLLQGVTLLLFLVASVWLWVHWMAPTGALAVGTPLVLAAIGTATLLTAGALGWTLVQTYHVGLTEAPQPVVPDLPQAARTVQPPQPRIH